MEDKQSDRSENSVKRVKRRRLQLAVAAVQLLASWPSSLASQQQGQSIKRVHPAITSPFNASQPGAPCNCVSHQPAITFRGAALEASDIRNPGWPRPGRKTLTVSLHFSYKNVNFFI